MCKKKGLPPFVLSATLLMLLTLSAAAAIQDKPDFSGRWVLESASQAAPDTPLTISVQQTLVRTNVRGEPMAPFFSDILIERELEKGSRSEKLMIGVTGGTVAGVVGGAAVGGRAGHGALPRRKFAVYWDGDSLVFENRSSVGEPPATLVWTERREVWSLDSAGFVRVGITTRNSVGPPTTLSFTYRRRTANDHGP